MRATLTAPGRRPVRAAARSDTCHMAEAHRSAALAGHNRGAMPPFDQRTDKPGTAVPAEPAAQRRAVAALLVALLSLTGVLALGDPQRGVYLVAYALARRRRRDVAGDHLAGAGQARPDRAVPHGSAAATAIAGIGILFSSVLLLAFIVLGRQMSAYGNCLSDAGTTTAQQSCQVQFTHAVNQEIASLRSAERG